MSRASRPLATTRHCQPSSSYALDIVGPKPYNFKRMRDDLHKGSTMRRYWTRAIRLAARDADTTGAARACEHALMRELRELLDHAPLRRFFQDLREASQRQAFPAQDLIALLPRHNQLAANIAEHVAACEAEGHHFDSYVRGALTDSFRELLAARLREMVAHVHGKHPASAPEMARRLRGAAQNAVAPVLAFVLDGAAATPWRRPKIDLDGDDLLGGL